MDSKGLDEMDNKILSVLVDNFAGGPVGLNTLSTAIGEQAETIEEVYEPYLIKEGFYSERRAVEWLRRRLILILD